MIGRLYAAGWRPDDVWSSTPAETLAVVEALAEADYDGWRRTMEAAFHTANLVRAKSFPSSVDAWIGSRPTPKRDRTEQIATARAAGVWED